MRKLGIHTISELVLYAVQNHGSIAEFVGK